MLIAFGAGLYGGLDLAFDFNTPNPQAAALFLPTPSRAAPSPARVPAYPVVFVGAFQSIARNGTARPPSDGLRGKMRDALARFDAIHVLADGPPSRGHYQLTASTEYDDSGVIALTARLIDTEDGSVAYSKMFSRDNRDGREEDSLRDQDAIVREVSAALAQPYGIIQAHESAKEATSGETHYRCLLVVYEYWRSYDPQQHRHARECLERATDSTPGFALGLAALAAADRRGISAPASTRGRAIRQRYCAHSRPRAARSS